MKSRLVQVLVVAVLIIGGNKLASGLDIGVGDIDSTGAADIISVDGIQYTVKPDVIEVINHVSNLNKIAETIDINAISAIESGIRIAGQIEVDGDSDINNQINIAEIIKRDAIEMSELDFIGNGRNLSNRDILNA